jgi:hypothetical protein
VAVARRLARLAAPRPRIGGVVGAGAGAVIGNASENKKSANSASGRKRRDERRNRQNM